MTKEKEIEELKKGCGERCFCKCISDNLKCGTVWNGEMHYCPFCMGKIIGYEAGQNSQKQKDLEMIDKVLLKLANVLHPSNQDFNWYKIIRDELKKELTQKINSQTEQNSESKVAHYFSKSDKAPKIKGNNLNIT